MKILVEYNGKPHYWVDTVVMHDVYDYTCAILVNNSGVAFPICIDKIKVVDDKYDYLGMKQREIEELKIKQSMLHQHTLIEAEIAKARYGAKK